MANYARGYSFFDAIRARVRNQAIGSTAPANEVKKYGVDAGATGLRSGSVPGPVGAGQYDTTFLGDVGSPTPFGMSPSTGVVDLSASPELRAVEDMKPISRAKAAAKSNLNYYGPYDPDSGFGRAANAFLAAVDVSPLGAFNSMLSGTTTVDPYGKTVSKPVGALGAVAEMNIEKQYEIAEKIRAGTPGFHQFYSGGQLVSISPQSVLGFDTGYAVLGTFSGTPQDAINQYSAAMGYDPETVNLQTRPGKQGFGRELDGFVPGSGGFREDGKFVDVSGRSMTLTGNDLRDHVGLVADIYGLETAVDVLGNASISKDVANEMMESLRSGELTARAVVVDGEIIGYETGSGGVVKDRNGDPVRSGSGVATSGAGIMSKSLYDSLKEERDFISKTSADGAFETGAPVKGYTEVSGRDSDGPEKRSTTSQSAASEDAYDPSDTFFAEGGEVPPDQVPAGDAPVAAEAGFIGQEPEGIPDNMTVADDVPLEVPEGTFVLNAAAVEFMGSADVKKMILEAMQEAEKQGIDIKQRNDKIPKEDLVSLVVSKGEVIIPPQLAEIIGYDRLNKINNRGKAEVERRVAESEQQEAPAPKPPILAKSGGFISKPV